MLNIHNRDLLQGRSAVVAAALALSLVSLGAASAPVRAAAPVSQPGAVSAPALSASAQVTATKAPQPLPTAPMPTEVAPTEAAPAEAAPTEAAPTETAPAEAAPTEAAPVPAEQEIIRGNQLVTVGSYTLRSGQTLRGDLTIFGGEAILEEGSRVEGNVSVLGGTADIAGAITEDMNLVGGSVRLRASAEVDGDVNVMGGSVAKDPGAIVRGETNRFTGPRVAPQMNPRMDGYDSGWDGPFRWLFDLVAGALAALMGILLITLFSIAAVALFPNNVARTAGTIGSQWLVSVAIGALTYVAVPILIVLLSITLCLIPVAVLLALAWAVAILFGWAIVARMVGERVMIGLKRNNWTLIGQTAFGAVLLALLGSIPIFGWLVGFVASSIGVGALILTRFGTQAYPRYVAPVATQAVITLHTGEETQPPPALDQPDGTPPPPSTPSAT